MLQKSKQHLYYDKLQFKVKYEFPKSRYGVCKRYTFHRHITVVHKKNFRKLFSLTYLIKYQTFKTIYISEELIDFDDHIFFYSCLHCSFSPFFILFSLIHTG